jgi:trafficking protein particle complex subunit 8
MGFQHYKGGSTELGALSDLKLPFTFCQTRQTRLRLPRDNADGDPSTWERLEGDWRAFWKSRGREGLQKSSKAAIDGNFLR